MNREPFNARLKAAMKIKSKKQNELADETGISKSMISEYLSGKYTPKQENIYKIAKALDVHESWLLGYDIPMNKTSSFKDVSENESFDDFVTIMLMDQLTSLNNRDAETALLYRNIYNGLKNLNSNGVRKVLDYVDDLNKVETYIIHTVFKGD